MSADGTLELTARLTLALTGRERVRLALLFGSRATGRSSPESDIDLAVDAPGVDLLALAGALSVELGAEVDLVSLGDATIPLLEALVQDALVVHESRPGLGAAWRARSLAELETDRPWYHRMRDAWLRRVAERGLDHGQ